MFHLRYIHIIVPICNLYLRIISNSRIEIVAISKSFDFGDNFELMIIDHLNDNKLLVETFIEIFNAHLITQYDTKVKKLKYNLTKIGQSGW